MPTTWMSEAKPLFKGGVAGGIAGYAYDRFISTPIRNTIGNFAGGWTDAVGSFAIGLAIKKFWKSPVAHDAAVGLFSHELANALETNVPSLGGGGGSSSPSSQLAPRAVIRGKMVG